MVDYEMRMQVMEFFRGILREVEGSSDSDAQMWRDKYYVVWRWGAWRLVLIERESMSLTESAEKAKRLPILSYWSYISPSDTKKGEE